MEDFRTKARDVAHENMTDNPVTLTYVSDVSRESVMIIFTLTALNGLEINMVGIMNIYPIVLVAKRILTVYDWP